MIAYETFMLQMSSSMPHIGETISAALDWTCCAVIPKRIRDLLNLENGDYVTFVVNKDRVEIQNSKVFIEEKIKK